MEDSQIIKGLNNLHAIVEQIENSLNEHIISLNSKWMAFIDVIELNLDQRLDLYNLTKKYESEFRKRLKDKIGVVDAK